MLRPSVELTPYELLRGRKPVINHMRIFGCRCYIHRNRKENLGKFDSRSDEGVFLGYFTRISAYTFLNQRLMKIEVSIHVTFDEDEKGMQHLLDPEEDEFIFQSSLQDETIPSNTDDDDERSIPSNRDMVTDSTRASSQTMQDQDIIKDNEVQEELSPLDEASKGPGKDIQQRLPQ